MQEEVKLAYGRRSREYSRLLGSMSSVHPADEQLVRAWSLSCDGAVIDAGCGPGHWTDFLHRLGRDVVGVDQLPAFIDEARAAFPESTFNVGQVESLAAPTGSVGGVLSWYSLIHHEPSAFQEPLLEFGRVLRPGGNLLLGFFEGATVEMFEHAIVPAYRWPVAVVCQELDMAGFDIIETHTRTSTEHRPHAAVHARRRTRP